MKRVITLLIVLGIIFRMNAQDSNALVLHDFLSGIVSLDTINLNQQEPLVDFKAIADPIAEKSMELTKETIVLALEEMSKYKYAIILVGMHSLIKITDPGNCKQSGSWGVCIPFGAGLIQQKGVLSQQEDYINNLIGIPDNQTRMLYFFN